MLSRQVSRIALNAPRTSRRLSTALDLNRTVSVIGVPIRFGQPLGGVDAGPDVLRKHNLVNRINQEGWDVHDLGDVELMRTRAKDHPNAKHSNLVGGMNKTLSKLVKREAAKGNFVLNLGGDHSMAIGTVSGILAARPNTGVIWVDAHADINTHLNSSSGNIHGMAVSFAMGLDNCHKVPGFEWMEKLHKLSPDQIVYIGLRDVDNPEKVTIQDLGIKAFSMHDVDKYGIGKVMEMALKHLSGKYGDSIHLSADIDSVDPILAPATGTRVRGGLTYREAHFICELLAETGKLGSMDMAEVNPHLVAYPNTAQTGLRQAVADDTVEMAVGMIGSALGERILLPQHHEV